MSEDSFDIPPRSYQLRPPGQTLLQDTMGNDSVLHENVVFPWQTGFFPEEQSTPFTTLEPLPFNSSIPSTSKQQQTQMQDMFITGTTTLGFIYPQGIILATDSRATASDLIVSQKLSKVIPISDTILCTLAGNAADCVYWLRILTKECRSYEAKYQTQMSARHAANLVVNTVRKYRGGNTTLGLSIGTLMASYDQHCGPQLYMLDHTGLLIEGHKFCVGSGEEYARAILETGYRPDLSEDDACALATTAIYHACRRDIHSGGFVRLYKINRDGWRQVSSRDVKDIYNDKLVLGGGDH